jgi:carbon storage regulator
MLVLTRRVGQTVRVGKDVTVTILRQEGNEIRIGINAPRNVPIYREELHERLQRCAVRHTVAARSSIEK